jgi:SP family arabinose:H+ symporter-like MFS transporter
MIFAGEVAPPNISTGQGKFNQSYLWTISLVAALGGLLFGYDWVVIGGAKPFYEVYFHLQTPSEQGWAMSCALVGCLLGAMVSGRLSERFGRKRMLIFAGLVFATSSLGTGLAVSFDKFVLWRIAGGLAIGLASSLSPMYIAEIAPAHLRGKLVSMNQLTIVIGIVLAQGMNWVIAKPLDSGMTTFQILQSWNGQLGWRWMFAITAAPATLFLVAMFFVPESPRWLAKRGSQIEALRILTRVGGPEYGAQVLHEIDETLVKGGPNIALRELLTPQLLRPLLLGVALAVLQQWCGINVIFNYAQEIFTEAGYSLSSILFNIVVTGMVMLVCTFIAINTVDRKGRRALMLSGCAGLAAVYICLGAGYAVHGRGIGMLLLVVGAIAVYSTTLAPVTWVLLSEIFPNRARAESMSIATTALWTACFVLTYTFPLLNRELGPAKTFWIYAAVCAAGFMLVKKWIPETKGKTLEQIEGFWK